MEIIKSKLKAMEITKSKVKTNTLKSSKYPRFSADVISVVLEFIDLPDEFLKLRRINRTFDQAAFRILLFKR